MEISGVQNSVLNQVEEVVIGMACRFSVRDDQREDFEQEGRIAAARAYNHYVGKKTEQELAQLMVVGARNAMRDWQRKVIRFESATRLKETEPDTRVPQVGEGLGYRDLMESALSQMERDPVLVIDYVRQYPHFHMDTVAEKRNVSRASVSRAVSEFKSVLQEIGFE